MRVLVADDDPTYRSLLQGLLAQFNFEVQLACDGQEALAALQQENAPQIAILDWKMPGLDGFDVCRQLRQGSAGSSQYILLMTSQTSRDELLRILVAGADDYLLKPFEPLDLKIRLRLAIRILSLEERLRYPSAV